MRHQDVVHTPPDTALLNGDRRVESRIDESKDCTSVQCLIETCLAARCTRLSEGQVRGHSKMAVRFLLRFTKCLRDPRFDLAVVAWVILINLLRVFLGGDI